ncbi:MAG: FHA domain-containing protein [Myxococcales bacterium]|nr:FHA domain-containing protein [Myxococcales bacterium]
MTTPPPPEPAPARRSSEGGIICRECGAHSPSGYRFCLGCGAVLNREGAKAAPPPATVSGTGPVQAVPVAGAAALGQARPDRLGVVAAVVATPAPAAAAERVQCGRCNGLCDRGEVFCKHCGSPLDAAAPGAAAPGSLPPPGPSPAELPRRWRAPTQSVVTSPPAAGVERPIELVQRARRDEAPPQAEGDAAVLDASDRPPFVQVDTGTERAVGRLVVIVEDGSEGKSLRLTGRQIDIGRVEGDIVLAEDSYLSPRHARLYREGDEWFVRNLDSLNGVYRRLRKPHLLRDRDLVLLGLEVLQFELVQHGERGLGHATQHGTLLFGSPAATRRARLCQRTVEGVVRDVYHLVSDETTIGREIGDLVFTSDPFMSRRHAVVRWQESTQQYVLADLNSSNGTYCAIREDVKLQNGDFIRLGQHLFRVDLPQKGTAPPKG